MSAPAKISLSSETLAAREKRLRLLLDGASVDDFELVGRGSSDTARSADSKESADKAASVALSRGGGSRLAGKEVKGPPPAIDVDMTFRRRIYFKVTTDATNVTVTPATIAGSLGTVCYVANSTVAAVCSMIRVRSVTVWPPSLTGSVPYPELYWLANATNQTKEVDLIKPLPVGWTAGGGMRFVPPNNTLLPMWFKASVTNGLFALTANAGSIILLDVEAQQSNVFAGPTATVATATLGAQYFLALDGPSSNKFVPLGLATTS